MNLSLILYGTIGCHLCEQAKRVIKLAGTSAVYIDIIHDDTLFERYGIRIPVLRREDTGAELGWPFDEVEVLRFLS
jgi:glutaredoxin